jgi:hypothetical protein
LEDTLKRLLIVLLPTVAFAGDLPSGLSDPLKDESACRLFASSVKFSSNDPVLDAIAFAEGRMKNGIHSDDAKSASDLLFARSNGKLDMADAAVAVFVNRVCRAL